MNYNYLWFILLAINVFGFGMVAVDKYKAKHRSWRIPEKRFFVVGLLGGAAGVYLSMKIFRHKTQHRKFIYGIPLLIIFNIAIVIYFIMKIMIY